MSTRSYTQSAKVDLDLWPRDPKSKPWSVLCLQGLIHRVPKLTLTFDPVTQNQNRGLYCVHRVLYTESQSWPWPLTPWPKINRVPPLVIHNLHVKFEIDWAKTVVCIMSTGSYTQSATVDSWPWPLTPWTKINRVPPLIMVNVHVKFESDWPKTVDSIVSTRSYTQSAKVDFDLWPRDPKSIGFLLSSSTTYMWSLKVIGQKL